MDHIKIVMVIQHQMELNLVKNNNNIYLINHKKILMTVRMKSLKLMVMVNNIKRKIRRESTEKTQNLIMIQMVNRKKE